MSSLTSSLIARMTALTILLILIAGGSSGIVAYNLLSERVEKDVIDRQSKNLKVAAAVMGRAMPGLKVTRAANGDVDRLEIAEIPAFDTHTLIDEIGTITGETATVFVIGEDGDFWRRTTNIKKPDGSRAVGTPLGKKGRVFPIITRGETFLGEATILGKDYFTIYKPIFAPGDKVIGILYAGVEKARVAGVLGELTQNLTVSGTIVLVVISAFTIFLLQKLLGPIRSVTGQISRLSEGDTDFELATSTRSDEIGQMERAMRALKASVAKSFTQAQMIAQTPVGVMVADPDDEFRISYQNAESRTQMAGVGDSLAVQQGDIPGDLRGTAVDIFEGQVPGLRALLSDPARLPHRARLTLGGETFQLTIVGITDKNGAYMGPMLNWSVVTRQEQLANDFEGSVKGSIDRLKGALEAIGSELNGVADAARQSGAQSSQVVASAETAGQNVQTVAAAAEELAASIREIGEQVARSADMSRAAVTSSDAAKDKAGTLSEAGQRVGEVVKVIAGIAEQTNLLALNATIEAARAGEAGKGFAVVASEVKNLANQTARATGEVDQEIGAIRSAVEDVVGAIGEIGETINQMSDIFSSVAAAVEEQQSATLEISRNIQEAAKGTTEVVDGIQTVHEDASRIGAAVTTVQDETSKLAADSEALGSSADAFLTSARVA